MITFPKQLATELRAKRRSAGLTQQGLAELAGVKQATISAFENRPEATSVETLFKILAALEVQFSVTSRGGSVDASGWSEEW